MIWPVSGTVLMNYSMDKTVYFATLDQYKYNPALVISGAEGDQVLCGAPGIIKSIDVTAQTGTCLLYTSITARMRSNFTAHILIM